MNRAVQATLLASVLGWTVLWGPAPAVAQLDDAAGAPGGWIAVVRPH